MGKYDGLGRMPGAKVTFGDKAGEERSGRGLGILRNDSPPSVPTLFFPPLQRSQPASKINSGLILAARIR